MSNAWITRLEGWKHYLKEKGVAPMEDGYYVLLTDSTHLPSIEQKRMAREQCNIIINPDREECVLYMPRQTYKCDHMFDKKMEDGSIIIETGDTFWAEHEESYQEWFEATR